MKRLIFALFVSNFLTLAHTTQAQTEAHAPTQPYTLEMCMTYAVEHATSVGEQRLNLDDARIDQRETTASFFPSISASTGGSFNFGRSIDPATNSYTTVTTFSNSYGISGSMSLFAGLQRINSLRAAKIAREMGAANLDMARDEVAIQTLSAYMDVVYYTEATTIAREQLEAARTTLRQAQRQYELGVKSAADVAEIESQEANYDYLLTTEQNNLALAYIKLREVMNYPQETPLEVVTHLAIEPLPTTATEEEVIDFALANDPRVRSAQLGNRYRQRNLAAAKGTYFPSLSIAGGYSTSYFIDFDHRSSYDPFWNQFKNNRGSYVQVSLSIPLFSGLSRRSTVLRARNNLYKAELQQRAVQQQVESEVAQNYQQMIGYGKQFVVGQKKERAAKLAYDGAVKKFENGLISALELQTAANSLLAARSEKLQARLQYLIKCRMVDYYNGKPLTTHRN